MKRYLTTKLALPCLLLAVSTTVLAQNPTLSLEAVKINDVSITPSHSITVNPGDMIEAEIFASDWSPDGEKLSGFQVSIDRASFASGATGHIKPLGWDRPLVALDDVGCFSDEHCPAEWPICSGGLCVGPEYDPGLGVFIDDLRLDWVFFPCNSSGSPCTAFALLDTSAFIRYAATPLLLANYITYNPPKKYCGTMRLGVSSDALGAFSFDILPPTQSALNDENFDLIQPLDLIGLTIDVILCGDGIVDPDEQCDDAGESATCNADCTTAECGDGTLNTTAGEECDEGLSNSDTEPDRCRTDCRIPACGDNVIDTDEECDGSSDAACPGACNENCVCGFCGDGIAGPGEECDNDGTACPLGSCESDCTCTIEIPTVSQWGLVILTLLLLIAAKSHFGYRLQDERNIVDAS